MLISCVGETKPAPFAWLYVRPVVKTSCTFGHGQAQGYDHAMNVAMNGITPQGSGPKLTDKGMLVDPATAQHAYYMTAP